MRPATTILLSFRCDAPFIVHFYLQQLCRSLPKACRWAALFIVLFIMQQRTAAQNKNYVSKVWVADNGDGTYKNPIIHADYSDPDAIRVGDDFYMTASSFNAVPGLPILHSKDLVNWRLIGHAFTRQRPLDVFSKPQHGNGVWAPSIRHHQ